MKSRMFSCCGNKGDENKGIKMTRERTIKVEVWKCSNFKVCLRTKFSSVHKYKGLILVLPKDHIKGNHREM